MNQWVRKTQRWCTLSQCRVFGVIQTVIQRSVSGSLTPLSPQVKRAVLGDDSCCKWPLTFKDFFFMSRPQWPSTDTLGQSLFGPVVPSGHDWRPLSSPNSNYYIRSPGFCCEALKDVVLCLFEKLCVSGLQWGEKKNHLWKKIERPQCFHNAFCFSFLLPIPHGATWPPIYFSCVPNVSMGQADGIFQWTSF